MTGTEASRTWLDGLPHGWAIAVHPDRVQPYTIYRGGKPDRFEATEQAAINYAMKRAQASVQV